MPMKKRSRFLRRFLKVLAFVAAGSVLSLVYLWGHADRILTRIADSKLKEFVSRSDSFDLRYSSLDLNLAKGTISLSGVVFSKDSLKATARRIEVGNIKPRQVWKSRQLLLDYIILKDVSLSATASKKAPKDTVSSGNESIGVSKKTGIKKYLDSIGVKKVVLDGGGFSFRRPGDSLRAKLMVTELCAFALGYNTENGSFSYSDSLYSIRLADIEFTSASGLYALSVDSLASENSGGVFIKNFHSRNTVGKKHLASRKGKVPSSWSDIKFKELHTSSVNLFRLALSKKIEIDSVFVEGERLKLFRDNRYLPKKPFKMPQEGLMSAKSPFHIGYLAMTLPVLDMEVLLKEGGIGVLPLRNIKVEAENISNEEGSAVTARLWPSLGRGRGFIKMTLVNDSKCSFRAEAKISNLKGHDFESLLNPLFGASVEADITSLHADVRGDRHSISGPFCMQYTGLEVHLDKSKVPQQKLADKASLVNTFSSLATHKSNPRKNQKDPFSCNVIVVRNPMKNFGGYMVSALLDGMMQTVLGDVAYHKIKAAQAGQKFGVKEMVKDEKEVIKNREREKIAEGKEKLKEKKQKVKGKIKDAFGKAESK